MARTSKTDASVVGCSPPHPYYAYRVSGSVAATRGRAEWYSGTTSTALPIVIVAHAAVVGSLEALMAYGLTKLDGRETGVESIHSIKKLGTVVACALIYGSELGVCLHNCVSWSLKVDEKPIRDTSLDV